MPEEFQSRLENVVVIIEGEPPEDMPDTLGLYEGVPLTERSLDGITLPDQITLFRGLLSVPVALRRRLKLKCD